MQLFYRTLGKGQPLIILHGLFGSSDNWLTISKQFAEKYKVFILDARNHGQSPHSEKHNYDLMAADLQEFMEQQAIVNPILIGHSMGGKTVMKFVTSYDTAVSKIVIVDIAPRYYPQHHQTYIKAMQAIDLQKLASRQEAENIFIQNGVTNIGERQFLMKNLNRDDEGRFSWKINLKALASEIENIGEGLPDTAHSDVPALFIKGSESHYYINESDNAMIRKIFTHVTIEVVQGSGHWVQAEKPAEFFKLATDFFES